MSKTTAAPSVTRIALASFIGTAIEFYDFYIYGMAAALGTFDDEELLELWQKIRRESIDTRLVFQRHLRLCRRQTFGAGWR